MRRALCVAGVVALVAAVASCGGDEPRTAPGSSENPLVAQPTDGGTTAGGRSNEAPSVAGEEQAEPGFQALVEHQSSKPRRRFSPCNLVSRPNAGAILGTRVAQPVEAPQGPTCIYRSEDGDQFVTLAVQALDFGAQKRQMEGEVALDLGSRRAYCGTLGEPLLNVRLSGTRVLTVGAPCPIAKRFAAAAVRQLHS